MTVFLHYDNGFSRFHVIIPTCLDSSRFVLEHREFQSNAVSCDTCIPDEFSVAIRGGQTKQLTF